MDAGFPMMDLPDDVVGKIVDKWDVPDYVPFNLDHVQINVPGVEYDDDDDDETREAKQAQWVAIVEAHRVQYEALIERTIRENAQALNAFRATCSNLCDEYRAKSRALQLKLWIQRGPTVAGGGRLRMQHFPPGGLALTLNRKISTANRAVHDYVYLDFDNATLEHKESCNYKPEWSSTRDAVFTFSNRLLFDLSTSKHDIMRELKRMIGRKIDRDGDGVEDEFRSLFEGYGLTKARVQEFDTCLVHRDATTHRGSYFDPGYDIPTDITYMVRFIAKFELPGGATFVAVGKMTPAYLNAFDIKGFNHRTDPVLWRDAMEERLKKSDALPHVLHLVTYERIGIVPKWLELERAVKAKLEHENDQQSEMRKRRRMDDTVVMTRFEKAVLRHKAAKYDNGGAAKAPANDRPWYEQFLAGQNAHKRACELETSVAELTSRAEAAEKARDALQARLDEANKKLGERADARFKQDVREARAEGRGHEVAMYAWAEQFNPERRC